MGYATSTGSSVPVIKVQLELVVEYFLDDKTPLAVVMEAIQTLINGATDYGRLEKAVLSGLPNAVTLL